MIEQLPVTRSGELVLAHFLVRAARADHAGEAPALAEERAAVEHPLHQAPREPEHRERKPHALLILEIGGVSRLLPLFNRAFEELFLKMGRPSRSTPAISNMRR